MLNRFLQTAFFLLFVLVKSRTLNTTNGSCAVAVDCVLLVPFPHMRVCAEWSIYVQCVWGVGLVRGVTLPSDPVNARHQNPPTLTMLTV